MERKFMSMKVFRNRSILELILENFEQAVHHRVADKTVSSILFSSVVDPTGVELAGAGRNEKPFYKRLSRS
jgi:hypothetical protein